ncbi:hypothetical protein [Aquimarina aggregata]|uniref:hypothetical protein n=1 Tax=Aquimarina aggregata TaxID=1642818 RepID=UPI002492942B|nr:hypothetical protein [Aquimarina aggregata]
MKSQFSLYHIESIHFINSLMSLFYRETGNKLSIHFNGSKGYLSNIEFESEGVQSDIDNRRIFLRRSETLNKNGSIKKRIMVVLLFDDETGLKISIK